MSAYKKGDKFIIELGDEGAFNLHYIADTGVALSSVTLDKFEKYDEAKIYDKGYNDGLEKAWAIARKIGCSPLHCDEGFTNEELEAVFPYDSSPSTILSSYSIQEAIKKIEDYETNKENEENKIEVGDVVIYQHKGYPDEEAVVLEVLLSDPPHRRKMYKVYSFNRKTDDYVFNARDGSTKIFPTDRKFVMVKKKVE